MLNDSEAKNKEKEYYNWTFDRKYVFVINRALLWGFQRFTNFSGYYTLP